MARGDDGERIRKLREEARERWDGGDADVRALAADLDSDDADERAEAAWALAEIASDADRSRHLPVDSRLAPLLDDEDRWVRRGASWALARVADANPARARYAVGEVTAALTDDDPLVRENSVLALASIASDSPRAVEPALSRLADLARGDDLAGRYAAETLRRLVLELDEDGFPHAIRASGEVADLVPGDADVVEVGGDADDENVGIRVREESEESAEAAASSAASGASDRGNPDEGGSPPDRIPAPPEVRADFRDFERLAALGTGPLTTDAKARVRADDGRHVVVALRALRPDAEVAPERVETALRAWEELADHDHVAPVLARGTAPRPWVATELADGGTLRDAIGATGIDRALWSASCVSAAVCHAHARGVVHGALRPGAVGLSRSLGEWPIPKVGDWGFGDLLAEVRSPPVPLAFAAPEHLAPERFGRPDHATDVYQLGALSYALFAGRPPFAGESREVAEKVLGEDPAPASAFAPDVPEAVDALLDRALTKDKPARFETAEDFRRALELIVDERGVLD